MSKCSKFPLRQTLSMGRELEQMLPGVCRQSLQHPLAWSQFAWGDFLKKDEHWQPTTEENRSWNNRSSCVFPDCTLVCIAWTAAGQEGLASSEAGHACGSGGRGISTRQGWMSRPSQNHRRDAGSSCKWGAPEAGKWREERTQCSAARDLCLGVDLKELTTSLADLCLY